MNVQHLTSNDEIASLRRFINWQDTLFKIRRWMFDVQIVTYKIDRILKEPYSYGFSY